MTTMSLSCDHMSLSCDHMSLSCDHMSLSCDHMSPTCVYMSLTCPVHANTHATCRTTLLAWGVSSSVSSATPSGVPWSGRQCPSHQAHRSPSGRTTTACQTRRRWSSSATRPHTTLSPPPSAPCAPIALLLSGDSPHPTPADHGASVCQQDSDTFGV